MRNIDDEIRKLQEKIDKLEEKKKKLSELTPQQQLATAIHSRTCNWNHIDGCGWDYESWDKPGSTRKQYLNRAFKILEKVSLEDALFVVSYI